MEVEIIFQLIGVILTIAGAAISIFAAMQARRDTKLQRNLELFAVEQEYFRDLRQWADRAIELLTEAIFLARLDRSKQNPEAFEERWSRCRRDLSALIEQGRLFLPNQAADGIGADKSPAYQGFRSPGLNPLVKAYTLLGDFYREPGRFPARATTNELWDLRKEFVSYIQNLLDPQARRKMLEHLRQTDAATSGSAAAPKMREVHKDV